MWTMQAEPGCEQQQQLMPMVHYCGPGLAVVCRCRVHYASTTVTLAPGSEPWVRAHLQTTAHLLQPHG